MNKVKRFHVFIVTLLLGGAIMCFRLFDSNFSQDGLREWAIDSLFVGTVLGFIALKWLKRKGYID